MPEESNGFNRAVQAPVLRLIPGLGWALICAIFLSCHQTVSEPYYLILDRAVKEYFLPDGDKSEGLRLLQEACHGNEDYPDLLCYNAGVLLLRENRPEEALDYFEKAHSLHDIPLYRSAVRTTRLELEKIGDGTYREKADQIILGCKKQEIATVDLIEEALGSDSSPRLQQFASQPLIENCMNEIASGTRQKDLLARIQTIRNNLPDLKSELRELELNQHPLNRLWNPFWKYGENPGGFPAVEAWAATLDAAKQGSSAGAEQAARRFFSLAELRGSDQGVALRRAGALLILQDPYFNGVRSGGLKALAQSNL